MFGIVTHIQQERNLRERERERELFVITTFKSKESI